MIHESWEITDIVKGPKFDRLRKIIKTTKVCPNPPDIFKALSMPVDVVRVCMMALSPYQRVLDGKRYATGLAMGVPDKSFDTPTLEILRESLAKEFGHIAIENDFDYTLEYWFNQGVLLLNRALTVPLGGESRAHVEEWRWFTDLVIKRLNDREKEVVFVFMGKEAKECVKLVDPQRHLIIQSCHPVATSYALTKYNYDLEKVEDYVNFFLEEVFSRVNNYLTSVLKQEPIKWWKQ